MSTTVYVGNLAFDVTSDELRALFQEAGEVADVQVGLGPPAGRARGFGFVQMTTPEAAELAVSLFHRRELRGRLLNVKRPQAEESSSFTRR